MQKNGDEQEHIQPGDGQSKNRGSEIRVRESDNNTDEILSKICAFVSAI